MRLVDNTEGGECHNCDNNPTEFYQISGWLLCQGCYELLDNKTGWCSVSCQLGNGCNGEC